MVSLEAVKGTEWDRPHRAWCRGSTGTPSSGAGLPLAQGGLERRFQWAALGGVYVPHPWTMLKTHCQAEASTWPRDSVRRRTLSRRTLSQLCRQPEPDMVSTPHCLAFLRGAGALAAADSWNFDIGLGPSMRAHPHHARPTGQGQRGSLSQRNTGPSALVQFMSVQP